MQSQELHQTQEQRQTQTITRQQLLQSQLIELPVTELRNRINDEMNDNPALDYDTDHKEGWEDNSLGSTDYGEENGSIDSSTKNEDYDDALDEALRNIGRDDEELPVYRRGVIVGGSSSQTNITNQLADNSQFSPLNTQVLETNLTEQQRIIMDYLIGSLDDDGYLRKSSEAIADELLLFNSLEVGTEEIEEVVKMLQAFDPAGIGARDLQECLLLQLSRKRDNTICTTIIRDLYKNFINNQWDVIKRELEITDAQVEDTRNALRRLNPKPGLSLGEASGRTMQDITPDFIIDDQDDGGITFTLNNGDVPQLAVSQSFVDMLKGYKGNSTSMSRQMKEALLYTKQKVEAARGFIEAVKTRNHTLYLTMRAIIKHQKLFFLEGDEALLRPMALKDIAEATALDISTISRVCSSKYVATRWGTFPLRYFFSEGYVTKGGEELSTREIKVALRELIENEDKACPLSDENLCKLLAEKGYPIARRTVAKYRDQLGIPIAKMRK